MGFREDVPLDGLIDMTPFASEALLGPEIGGGARFGGTSPSFRMGQATLRPPQEDAPIFLRPMRSGAGPSVRSTSLELEPWPSVVWDVNGYYCALGVGFRATRKQLLTAYTQLNGQEDEYLTYVFKQLLNPATRRKYDSAPLGSLFFDQYVEADLKRRAQALAQRWNLEPTEILKDWGFHVEEPGAGLDDHDPEEDLVPEDDGEDPVDIPQESREDESTPPAEQPEPDFWPYSYYLWKVRRKHCGLDFGPIMRRWQEAIVAECQRQRVLVRFAVGLTSEGDKEGIRFLTMSVEGATVAFISADHVDDIEDIAPQAVHRLFIQD